MIMIFTVVLFTLPGLKVFLLTNRINIIYRYRYYDS
jgi:hypothetical protein